MSLTVPVSRACTLLCYALLPLLEGNPYALLRWLPPDPHPLGSTLPSPAKVPCDFHVLELLCACTDLF